MIFLANANHFCVIMKLLSVKFSIVFGVSTIFKGIPGFLRIMSQNIIDMDLLVKYITNK